MLAGAATGCGASEPPTGPDPDGPSDTVPPRPLLEGTWTRGPDLPVGLYSPSVHLHGGVIHVLGGATRQYGSDEGTTTRTFLLDPSVDTTWRIGPDYPVEGMRVGLASRGDTLYGVGGLAFPGKRWDRFFRLLPGAVEWERLPFPDEPRGLISALAVDGGLLVFEEGGSGAMWRWEKATDAWTRAAPQPLPRMDARMVRTGGAVYVAYGEDPLATALSVNFIDRYDPGTDSWTRPTFGPSSRRDAGVAAADGRIHVVGGLDPAFRLTATHDAYEPATDTWYEAPALPEARAGLMGVAVGGSVWFMGGGTPAATPGLRREVWIFTPS